MDNAILATSIGEFYWEFARFAPYVFYRKKKKNAKLIVMTRKENFDIYGLNADILIPLNIDDIKYKADCFKLTGYPESEYNNLIKVFKYVYSKRFNIIEQIIPDISKRNYTNKNQFDKTKYIYDYKPRINNSIILNAKLDDKKNIIIAPRHIEGKRRNWGNWQEFYNLIVDNGLLKEYNFIICGKNNFYVPDKEKRFIDINYLEQNINTSAVGFTIEAIKRSILTVGSQSAIPNISLLLGTEVLEWGHQRKEHTIDYNITKTPVTFLDDLNYTIKPEIVFDEMIKILKRK